MVRMVGNGVVFFTSLIGPCRSFLKFPKFLASAIFFEIYFLKKFEKHRNLRNFRNK